MKKIVSFCLIVALCLGLYGCGNNSKYNLKDAKTCTIADVSFKYPKEWESYEPEPSEKWQLAYFSCAGMAYGEDTMDVYVWHDKTKDTVLENTKNYESVTIEELDNITVAGQDCYYIKYSESNVGATTEDYVFDSPKGAVVFSNRFVEGSEYKKTLEGFEDVSKILPDILKTVTINQ